MNKISQLFLVLSCFAVLPGYSAVKMFRIKKPGGCRHPGYFQRSIPFRVEVISDTHGIKEEARKNQAAFITAIPGERYAVRLHNPLPVRVAVNLTVDGLNSITGKPSGIANGAKWMIAPHSYITIRGWQVSQSELRRFFFTKKQKSYAKWRSKHFGTDLSVNAGVIGAAYFWNKKELRRRQKELCVQRHPKSKHYSEKETPPSARDYALSAPKAGKSEEQQAGTGMGARESHPTHLVDFDYNTGMYQLSQALLIYYDFAKQVRPNPFPGLDFAPEM